MKRAILILLMIGGTARAEDFWQRTDEDSESAVARRNYEKAMEDGDSFAQLATSRATGGSDMRRLLEAAIKSYQNASLARPDAAEPHYRAGLILHNFFVECPPINILPLAWCSRGRPPAAKAAQLANEWGAFVKLAPLDPRVDFQLMFDLAIANTQAARDTIEPEKVKARIQTALDFYRAALQRTSLDGDLNAKQILGNMAESYMMLGDLDDAITMYQRTLRVSTDVSTVYGLAVALDRDEQGAKARELMRALGVEQFQTFKDSIQRGDTFFVPDGESFYYLALAEESFGDFDQAAIDWQNFVLSGAHPQYAERAKANRDALIKGHKHTKAPPADSRVREYDR
ncbi:MAG TPA: hypothetical protein VL463_31925 [Kofleriaceae bacterium]|jgi:tetratricopeptide (TPR) repeat protein|nr:hypothetical protein [Kofleriaceae bacterium]